MRETVTDAIQSRFELLFCRERYRERARVCRTVWKTMILLLWTLRYTAQVIVIRCRG